MAEGATTTTSTTTETPAAGGTFMTGAGTETPAGGQTTPGAKAGSEGGTQQKQEGQTSPGTTQETGDKGQKKEGGEGSQQKETPEGEGTTTGKDGGEPKGQTTTGSEPFKVQLPEGVTADEKLLGQLEGLVKDSKLPPDAAQALVNGFLESQERMQEGQIAAIEAKSQEWIASIKADPDLGGAKLPETRAAIQRAMTAYGSKELSSLLDSTRLGDHPELVRFVARIGRALGEDKAEGAGQTGGQGQPSQDQQLRDLYPSMFTQSS